MCQPNLLLRTLTLNKLDRVQPALALQLPQLSPPTLHRTCTGGRPGVSHISITCVSVCGWLAGVRARAFSDWGPRAGLCGGGAEESGSPAHSVLVAPPLRARLMRPTVRATCARRHFSR